MSLNENVSDKDTDCDDNIPYICSTELYKVLKWVTNHIGSYCASYREFFHMVLK